MKFALTGMGEALANLRRIDEGVSHANLEQDALAAVEPVVHDAQRLAPVGEGDLRDSIQSMVLEDGTVAVVIRDWKGHFFEFGTVNMRAQPMLGPAWHANESVLLDSFSGAIRARIEGNPSLNRSRVAIRFEGV